MAELLTTKQMQERLKIDRVTVYRMLNDGRLKGHKVGNQWRFPQSEIDRVMGVASAPEENNVDVIADFPSGCIKEVQDIFAGIIGIGAVTVTLQGTPLTEPTYSNPFCKMILASESGRLACQASWREIALRVTGRPNHQVCHAGLCYKRSAISEDESPQAWLIAGQYYLHKPDKGKEADRVKSLAEKHNIPADQLQQAAHKIPVLSRRQQDQVQEWTPKVAATFQSILCERSDLMGRLQRIAELSSIMSTLSK